MKSLHRFAVGRLECDMRVRQRSTVRCADEKLVGEKIAFAFASQVTSKRLQDGAIEAFAGGQVGYDELHVVDQAAQMKVHDAFRWGGRAP